jgi:hypothetical protein
LIIRSAPVPLIPVHLAPELAPWLAALLPVTSYPASTAERTRSAALLSELHALLLGPEVLNIHLYLQAWKLMANESSQILDDNLGAWWPIVGCGVWPDREPPRGWTEERLSDSGAALFTGEEVPLMNHKLLRISVEAVKQPYVAETMQGYGGLVEIFSTDPTQQWEMQMRKHYLPRITEKRFQREKFYAPLLDSASLAATSSATELDANLGGAYAYLRESAEDKGLLLLWRADRLPELGRYISERNPFSTDAK